MDITNTSLINLDSITSGVREMIIGVVSAAIIFYLLFKRQVRIQKAEDMKTERCKELEGYLRNHSNDLVNDVLSKWFDLIKSLHLHTQDLHIATETPLAIAIYELPENRIIKSLEFYNIKSDVRSQAVSHLRAEEYTIEDTQFMAFWLECETLSDKYLKKSLEALENIKKRVLTTSIPQKFTEWDGKGTSPPTCYILDNTVYAIYQEAKSFMIRSEFLGYFKIEPEQGFFRVGSVELYAKSSDESFADEFIETVYGIAKDKTLTEELKSLDTEKEFVDGKDGKVNEFRRELNKIIYDFEKRYYILKCTCDCCKSWVDELKRLDESYYKKLISPD